MTTLALATPGTGCRSSRPERPSFDDAEAACIYSVMEVDEELAAARNDAPRAIPVGEAVRQYVDALSAIDLSDCPARFREALLAHLDAWRGTLLWLDRNSEMRGDMHEIFDRIGTGPEPEAGEFREAVQRIFDTWDAVEASVTRTEAAGDPVVEVPTGGEV